MGRLFENDFTLNIYQVHEISDLQEYYKNRTNRVEKVGYLNDGFTTASHPSTTIKLDYLFDRCQQSWMHKKCFLLDSIKVPEV
ncbi:hypothetical protein HNY73_008353 [Argiope bruennichi]|uniref:Uncharacterized protein n=1 Tax=Argiope bruennichi TaxID=94029 RepID=A0A8T0F692_ARGBR|nr:hypothetical protein HNY73_008353 [Argiope bruennichi]